MSEYLKPSHTGASGLPLAIATIPAQQWGPVYDDQQALHIGTVFQDLDMPFYAAEGIDSPSKNPPKDEREQMMFQIQQVSFVLDDLTLYLDTHPQDQAAKLLFTEKQEMRKKLKMEFAQKFYPLTRDCVTDCSHGADGNCFSWQAGPKPWEGACV